VLGGDFGGWRSRVKQGTGRVVVRQKGGWRLTEQIRHAANNATSSDDDGLRLTSGDLPTAAAVAS
jgi:hypothetical protein